MRLRWFALATGASTVTSAKFLVQESIQVAPCNYERLQYLLVITEAISFLWRIPASFCFFYLLLSINKSLELHYFSTKESGFCRPFPLHIINFNAGEYLLVGHVVSLYINLLTHDVTFKLFLLLGYVIILGLGHT